MEGRELRRSMTLSEQLAVEDSPNPPTAPTRVAVKRQAFAAGSGPGSVSHRTLMDIIKEEHDANGGAGAGINWRSLKERLRLRRTGAGAGASASASWATSSGHPCPISDPEVVVSVRPNPATALGRSISRSVSIRNAEIPFRGSASRRGAIVSEYNLATAAAARGAEEEEDSDSPARGGSGGDAEEGEGCEGSNRSGAGEAEAAAEEQPVRISLMALLEQTDRWGGEGEAAAEEEEEEMAENDGDGEGDGGGMYYVCCVCMVRHKGAAFIPCGHTFCRLCSRELWVSRGNCPLCNGFILEILDIF